MKVIFDCIGWYFQNWKKFHGKEGILQGNQQYNVYLMGKYISYNQVHIILISRNEKQR